MNGATTLPRPPDAQVARLLREHARQRPEAIAIREPVGDIDDGHWQTLTFAELDAEVDRSCHALTRAGLRRGDLCVLMVPPGREFYILTFALLRFGAVVVLIDPGIGAASIGRCLRGVDARGFIGVSRAHWARVVLRWGGSSTAIKVAVGGGLFPPGCDSLESWRQRSDPDIPFDEPLLGRDDPAAVLFTSGSTGTAKGALYHHGIFEAQAHLLKQIHGIEAGEVDLATFPLFGLFGLALGMTSVIPRMNFSRPAEANSVHLIDVIEQSGVTSLFASPALLGNLSRHLQEHPRKLKTVRRVISAGAPVAVDVIEGLLPSLDADASIATPYGATEALPISIVDHRDLLGANSVKRSQGCGVLVGKPVPGIDVELIPISDEPITSWQETTTLEAGIPGEICVRGPVVTRSYYRLPKETTLAKIHDGDEIWHRTGDLGIFDEEGRIWFIGRKSQRLETTSGTMHTVAIEGIFDADPAIRRSALVGIGIRGRQLPVLMVEEEAGCDTDRLREEILEKAKTILIEPLVDVLFPGPFPVDIRHNAKIFREKLALVAARTLS